MEKLGEKMKEPSMKATGGVDNSAQFLGERPVGGDFI
jgi:hypothetical protein